MGIGENGNVPQSSHSSDKRIESWVDGALYLHTSFCGVSRNCRKAMPFLHLLGCSEGKILLQGRAKRTKEYAPR